jgi:hypothetical protein
MPRICRPLSETGQRVAVGCRDPAPTHTSRGKQGVLITANAGGGAHGTQLERTELIGLADGWHNIAEQLSKLAVTHAHDDAGGPELQQLIDNLKALHKGTNVEAARSKSLSDFLCERSHTIKFILGKDTYDDRQNHTRQIA